MQKDDIALAATSARSLNRHWRAKKLSWNVIGKIRYLYDGAIEYMDPVTLVYPKEQFNKLRTALGFKQDSELIELVESADAFRIVRHQETGEMMAFMTPLVPDRYKPTPSQVIIEPSIQSEVFNAKVNAIANANDRDKISENLRVHKRGINMKVLLAGNVPQFHVTPSDEAVERISNGLKRLFCDPKYSRHFFGEFYYHYQRKYHVEELRAKEVLACYIARHLTKHMACRVGIENWPSEAIETWVKNYFGARKLEYVITEAKQTWEKCMEEK